MLFLDEVQHPLPALLRHGQSATAEDFLDREQSCREVDHPPACRGLGFHEHRLLFGAVGQRELVAVALFGHHQFDGIGHQFQRLLAPTRIEDGRMAGQRRQGAVAVEVEGFLVVPAGGIFPDGPQRPPIVVGEVVEARVLFVEPLHGHHPAGSPVAALDRLLQHLDRHLLGVDEPRQPF